MRLVDRIARLPDAVALLVHRQRSLDDERTARDRRAVLEAQVPLDVERRRDVDALADRHVAGRAGRLGPDVVPRHVVERLRVGRVDADVDAERPLHRRGVRPGRVPHRARGGDRPRPGAQVERAGVRDRTAVVGDRLRREQIWVERVVRGEREDGHRVVDPRLGERVGLLVGGRARGGPGAARRVGDGRRADDRQNCRHPECEGKHEAALTGTEAAGERADVSCSRGHRGSQAAAGSPSGYIGGAKPLRSPQNEGLAQG